VDHIILAALAKQRACQVRRVVGRCKRKDNKQNHLQQIQQAFAGVEVGGIAYGPARHIAKL